MAYYTLTLRDIIYQISQDKNPYDIAVKEAHNSKYPFIRPSQDISIFDRITMALPYIISPNIEFYSQKMKEEFWYLFCEENLMREIEYDTVSIFLIRFDAQLRKVIWRYNQMYATLKEQYDITTSYRDKETRIVDEDTSGNLESNSGSENESNRKSVFEDTPESRLLNEDYATSITQDDNHSTGAYNQHSENTGTRDVKETVNREGQKAPDWEMYSKFRKSLDDVIANMVAIVSKPLFLKIYT